MGCKINPNSPILPKILHRKSRSSSFPSCSLQHPLLTQTQPAIKFQTLKSCKLGIARYPDFDYNAEGGSGNATVKKLEPVVSVTFDIGTLYIPPLSSATTRFLGLPLPPFLKIEIVPEVFEGVVNRETGKIIRGLRVVSSNHKDHMDMTLRRFLDNVTQDPTSWIVKSASGLDPQFPVLPR